MQAKSEDTLLFIALTPKLVKIKPIYKFLIEFAEKKQSVDFSSRFNVILFQENGPVYLDDFTLSFDNALNLLKKYEGKIVRANIAGGILLAATFIIQVYKKISDKAFRLIILMDKGSLNIPDVYLPVLYELLDKIKDMPFYLDILKLGERDEEYSKLDTITKRYSGKFYEIKSPKMLQEFLGKLAEKKVQYEDSSIAKMRENNILIQNQPFYENLADKPKILVSLETCSICFKKDDKTVVKCPNCDSIAHMSCWANWAKATNIGIPYVFRCHICFNLLKLDKGFVEIVQTGKFPTPEIEPKPVDLVSFLQQLETKRTPQAVQAEDPLAVEQDSIPEEQPEVERFFEKFQQELEPIPTPTTPMRLEPIPKPVAPRRFEPIPQPATPRRPEPIPKMSEPEKSEKKADKKREPETKVVFCPSCSKITTSQNRFCPSCGFPLK